MDYSQCCGLRDTLPFNMDFAICERCEAKSQTLDEGGTYLLDDGYWIEWIAEQKKLPVDVIERMYELIQANREYDDLINQERRKLAETQAERDKMKATLIEIAEWWSNYDNYEGVRDTARETLQELGIKWGD